MQRIVQAFILTLSLLLVSSAYGLRCGNRVIVEGYSQARVMAFCGTPYWQWRSNTFVNPFGTITTTPTSLIDDEEIWGYNFGPRRFFYLLTFRDGRLVNIETDGYGF
ncbi:MAG: hypothetical protein CMF50_04565 [Legionellales bacterium]|mgnify:CR=1 FL=1|nr:hypothetical protein [Legionellales bacterium]